VTSPRAGGADRFLGAGRARGTRTALGSLAILLLVGLLLRLTIAYVLLPGSGFKSDIGTFTAWAIQLGQHGPSTFYASAGFADWNATCGAATCALLAAGRASAKASRSAKERINGIGLA